ncbi:MAG TPA: DUF2752 domain-containing protein [Anaerolineae bacterium]|nr:DUF2752 domain-containing protein [Anaerolineae bacterium]
MEMTRRKPVWRIDLELIFWIVGLIGLAVTRPTATDHYTLCVFKRMGFRRCPGCGLGHAISYLFHGHVRESVQAHPLGILAVATIISRVAYLLRRAPE